MSDMGRKLYRIGSDLQRLSTWAGSDIVDDLTDVIEKLIVMRAIERQNLIERLRIDAEKEGR
jgi:hypothetical protein